MVEFSPQGKDFKVLSPLHGDIRIQKVETVILGEGTTLVLTHCRYLIAIVDFHHYFSFFPTLFNSVSVHAKCQHHTSITTVLWSIKM